MVIDKRMINLKPEAQAAGSAIEVMPLESLSVEPVSVRATGLQPGSRVTISIVRTDAAGVKWESRTRFVAGDGGIVDPAIQLPLAGDYSGVDRTGLFWFTSDGRWCK